MFGEMNVRPPSLLTRDGIMTFANAWVFKSCPRHLYSRKRPSKTRETRETSKNWQETLAARHDACHLQHDVAVQSSTRDICLSASYGSEVPCHVIIFLAFGTEQSFSFSWKRVSSSCLTQNAKNLLTSCMSWILFSSQTVVSPQSGVVVLHASRDLSQAAVPWHLVQNPRITTQCENWEIASKRETLEKPLTVRGIGTPFFCGTLSPWCWGRRE